MHLDPLLNPFLIVLTNNFLLDGMKHSLESVFALWSKSVSLQEFWKEKENHESRIYIVWS